MILRVSLFDHLRLSSAGQERPWEPRPRVQRLLAYLLLQRRRPLTREHVAFTLWPDSTEPNAFGTLRRALSDLRAALPAAEQGEWIFVSDTSLQWNADAPYWLDIDAFEQAIREESSASLHEAVDLYGGDLLVGWDDEWVVAERERLRQLQIDALRRLVGHHRAIGEYEAGLALARRALALDPLAEATHRDLIELLYVSGDRGAALAAYDRLSALLAGELGVEPMAETRALRAAIVDGAPLPTGTAPALSSASIRSVQGALPALVGRDAELKRLAELWESAVAGHGLIAAVSGDAGVGKSRLVLGLVEDVVARGGLALVGHCYEFEQALPYQAVVEMLRNAANLLRHTDLAPAHRSTLARLVPDLLGASGGSASVSSPDELRAQVFEALLQSFLALARSQPLLLVFEDVHWAAESTLDWLTYVAPRLDAGRVLVVITHRTDEIEAERPLARLHRRLARTTNVATLLLTPLTSAAHRELVIRLSGLPDEVAAPLAERLFAETAGNPFFLHEIVRGLVETGRITVHDGQWAGEFVEAAPSSAVPLPDSVRELITARVERLQPESKIFIQVAAVAGRVFEYGIVQRSTGWTDEPALHALEDVLARGFVGQRDGQEDFAFTHHLIQEVIYAGMTTPRRVYWHRRLTDVILELRPDDVEALAHHFSRAGDDEQARTYYARAGDRAQQLAALDDAARLYRSALNRWPEGDRAGRAELLYKRGQCQWVLGELHAALESLAASRVLFESLGDNLRVGDIERMIGRLYWEQTNRQAALDHYQRALAILEREGESVELARAISAISQMHMLASEYDQSIAWGERALALAERLGAEDVAIHAQINIGSSLASLDESERGLTMLRDSLRRALAANLAHDAMRTSHNLAEQLLSRGRYLEAQASNIALLEYARRVHSELFTGIALKALVQVKWWTGQWAEALADRQALLDWVRVGSPPRLTIIWADRVFGMLHNDLGQPELACQVLERSLASAREAAEDQTTVPHLAELARAYAALGRAADAEHLIEELLDWVGRFPYIVFDCIMPLLVACRWHATRPEPLDRDARQASVAWLQRAAEQIGTTESRAALAEGAGLALLAEGSLTQAVAQLQQAVIGWGSIGRPYDQARALGALGDACHRDGNLPAARAAFDRAITLYDTLANQLDDPELKASFLDSHKVRHVHSRAS